MVLDPRLKHSGMTVVEYAGMTVMEYAGMTVITLMTVMVVSGDDRDRACRVEVMSCFLFIFKLSKLAIKFSATTNLAIGDRVFARCNAVSITLSPIAVLRSG
jgi:hypothetical protein